MRGLFASWLHRLAHGLGVNRGHVMIWPSRSGRLMEGFSCLRCGKLESVRPVGVILRSPKGLEFAAKPKEVKPTKEVASNG